MAAILWAADLRGGHGSIREKVAGKNKAVEPDATLGPNAHQIFLFG
jgi:hypothetical protein